MNDRTALTVAIASTAVVVAWFVNAIRNPRRLA